MAITPISQLGNLESTFNLTQNENVLQTSDDFIPFSELLKNAVSQVEQSEQAVKAAEVSIATGDADDLHNIMIEVAKADLAVQTFVQVRNKALDAYNEIMRITL
jgi:flagellar hook-basal body complex protein FliE